MVLRRSWIVMSLKEADAHEYCRAMTVVEYLAKENENR